MTSSSTGVATAVAAPALTPLLDRDGRDEEGGCGIHPPEPEQRVRAEADQKRDRQIRAQLRLRRLLDRRRGVQLAADAALPGRQQRHRRRCEGGEADPEPARVRLVAADQRAQRLDADVGGEDEEGDGEQLLGAPLCRARAETGAGEEPQTTRPASDSISESAPKPISAIEPAARPAPTATAASRTW